MSVVFFAPLFGINSFAEEVIGISSPAFSANQDIPSDYTCDGKNISPPLKWTGTPKSAVSLVLIAEDPDASRGNWIHWVIYNLPPVLDSLPEGLPGINQLINGEYQGTNDFGKIGYGGPCPPDGAHRYFFRIYALDILLDKKPGLTALQVREKMKDHIVAQGEFMGAYQRIKKRLP